MAEKSIENLIQETKKVNLEKKPKKLDIKDVKLLEYFVVGKGVIKFDDEDLSFFDKETWKLYVTTVGNKILNNKKYNISGECMIQFFPIGREKLLESARKNSKTFLTKTLIKPLFFIKYDSNLYIELIEKSGEKIPSEIFFMILCR